MKSIKADIKESLLEINKTEECFNKFGSCYKDAITYNHIVLFYKKHGYITMTHKTILQSIQKRSRV